MNDELIWLAHEITEWKHLKGASKTLAKRNVHLNAVEWVSAGYYGDNSGFTERQWQAARRELGLDKPEDEMTDVKWSEWIEWIGGECPLTNGTKYQVRFRLGNECGIQENPELLDWIHHNSHGDITAYRYQLPKTLDSTTRAEWTAASRAVGWGEPTPEEDRAWQEKEKKMQEDNVSDGSTASYYELPPGCTELQDLISYRNLNSQDGEIFRAIYRKGRASHSDELRDARKVLFYAKAEVERLERKCIG